MIKLVVSLCLGISLIIISVVFYLIQKKKPNPQMKLKQGQSHWLINTLSLVFFISGILVILFGCLNF